ncbi:MAG TPA: hypothetical protein VGM83_17285 [Devosiaceae bacterium]|jgi:hypothetical protein
MDKSVCGVANCKSVAPIAGHGGLALLMRSGVGDILASLVEIRAARNSEVAYLEGSEFGRFGTWFHDLDLRNK